MECSHSFLQRVRSLLATAAARPRPRDSKAAPGPHGARGFTLIELLMVIVIIGILVTVLIPRYAGARDRAYVAALTSELRNLTTAEESYYYGHDTYAPSVGLLPGYNPTVGASVSVNEATPGGWSASVASANTSRHCFIFYGTAAPVGVATQEGLVACQ